MHDIAAKAVCFGEAMRPEFATYQQQVVDNAKALAEELQNLGMRLVSGGTDNHLMLVDVGAREITGRDAERALEAVGIIVNKNTIPYDQRSATVTSGIRLGTPALTTRGLGEGEMKTVARFIVRVLDNLGDERVAEEVKQEVADLAQQFPVPGGGS
jgi:glycine hydroxymethyltransferase